jgi:hypothetical protein
MNDNRPFEICVVGSIMIILSIFSFRESWLYMK